MTYMNPTAEWQFLGGLINGPKEQISRYSPALFTDKRSDVFRAMQLAEIDHGAITFEGISKHLKKDVPGELFAAMNGHGNMLALSDELVRLAKKRSLRESAKRIQALAENFDPDDSDIFSAFDFQPVTKEHDSSMTSAAKAFLADFEKKRNGTYKFASTGLRFLDSHMGGEWKPQALTVLLGNVGSGKTALVTDSMLRMAERDNPTPSLFLSLEMSREELTTRWLANKLSIDSSKLQTGMVTSEQEHQIENAIIDLQQLPMYLIEDEDMRLAEMIYQMRKHVHQCNTKVIFIDYLQIVNHSPTGNRNADLGDFSLQLKHFAKREHVAIVLLSQVNGNDGVDAIRDSGEVRAVAGVITYLKPLDMLPGEYKREVQVEWPKNRYGKTSSNMCLFDGVHQRFEDIDIM